MTESPASAAPSNGLKVRRYVSSDIPAIVKLAAQAYGNVDPPFSAKRLSFILNNNLTNALMHANVLVDYGEIVGVLIGTLATPLNSDQLVTQQGYFHIADEYKTPENIAAMKLKYNQWADLRKAHYVEPEI
jgi:hypothetical protein